MTSKKDKGNAAEREFEKYLQRIGYDTYRFKPERVCIGPGKWICKQNDGFGLFDIMGSKRANAPIPFNIIFVQVKTHDTDYSGMKEKLRKWFANHARFPVSICALKVRGRIWRLFEIGDLGFINKILEHEHYWDIVKNAEVQKEMIR